jgi:hypothetical protein
MNLFVSFKLTYARINRPLSPEAGECTRQAGLGLVKIVGESLLWLIFKLLVKELIRGVLFYLIGHFSM